MAPTGTHIKHTLVWQPTDWDRIKAATEILSARTRVAVSVQNFVRSAALERAEEVVGAITPPTNNDPPPAAA